MLSRRNPDMLRKFSQYWAAKKAGMVAVINRQRIVN
jgi:hypothetical protein